MLPLLSTHELLMQHQCLTRQQQLPQENSFFMVTPIWAGDLDMVTLAASKAVILSVAVPFPPEMMAPAWPIRRPGGAVRPADSIWLVMATLQVQSLARGLAYADSSWEQPQCSLSWKTTSVNVNV